MVKRAITCVCVVILSAVLAGCAADTPSSAAQIPQSLVPASSAPSSPAPATPVPEPGYTPDWRIEPYLQAANITGLQEMSAAMCGQTVFSHLAIQTAEGGGWQFFNAATGRIFPEEFTSPEFIGMTFFDALPFYAGEEGTNFSSVPWSYEDVLQYAETVLQEEGIQLDCGAHGGLFPAEPVWTEQGMMSIDLGPCLYPINEPLPEGATVARIADLNNGKRESSGDLGWYRSDGKDEYDGFVLVDPAGNRLNETVYENGLPYREGVAAVQQNGRWGYVDQSGIPVTDFCYEPIMTVPDWNGQPNGNGEFPLERAYPYSANEGYIPMMKDGLCGVIDTQGNEVVPLIFEDITSVFNGAVWVKQDGKWGLLALPQAA